MGLARWRRRWSCWAGTSLGDRFSPARGPPVHRRRNPADDVRGIPATDPDQPRGRATRHTAARSAGQGFRRDPDGACLFWSASNYAEELGAQLADRYAADVAAGGGVHLVVYSPQRLHLTAPKVREEPLAGPDSAYKFRYTGLVLLDHIGGTYFLVSEGWTPGDGVVIVLDAKKIQVEFVPATPTTER